MGFKVSSRKVLDFFFLWSNVDNVLELEVFCAIEFIDNWLSLGRERERGRCIALTELLVLHI